jgi:hypothetical protein
VKIGFVRLLLALTFVGCSSVSQISSTIGTLEPGGTLTVVASQTTVNVYKPAIGDPADRYTIAASIAGKGAPPPPPTIHRAGRGIVVNAPDALYALLVRLPDKTNLVVQSTNGNVNVTDVTGNVDVNAGHGNVKIMVPGYAQASAQAGNVDVTIGTTQWPGTLRFTTQTGDVNVYVPETAKFHVHMHTDNGTLFTDFGLRGSAQGTSETIDANVNGGAAYGIDIESHRGTVRLLRLAPQA